VNYDRYNAQKCVQWIKLLLKLLRNAQPSLHNYWEISYFEETFIHSHKTEGILYVFVSFWAVKNLTELANGPPKSM
jgi:hypothetical protein